MVGDQYGLPIPADPATLLSGGAAFLTKAFRASGVLADNSVVRISDYREISGGSTGRKVVLSVEYDRAAPDLHTELFVKFSRDLDNPVRDRGKTQMEPEVRFASLSRAPEFPIAVPCPQFADYHRPPAPACWSPSESNSTATESSANTTSASTTRCPSP
ncbi:hypothetical protein I550_2837 [Mycobacterium intracellulare 1956]|uniref:Uncharacterized protein n=1 Tax=Mycobacterium intracellulare 1956 TaxID=1299331 RepID=X8CUF7_MYCIT|nr:hypothetical protein I550_2837 [Mycobacterium intracellulare 1956]